MYLAGVGTVIDLAEAEDIAAYAVSPTPVASLMDSTDRCGAKVQKKGIFSMY